MNAVFANRGRCAAPPEAGGGVLGSPPAATLCVGAGILKSGSPDARLAGPGDRRKAVGCGSAGKDFLRVCIGCTFSGLTLGCGLSCSVTHDVSGEEAGMIVGELGFFFTALKILKRNVFFFLA